MPDKDSQEVSCENTYEPRGGGQRYAVYCRPAVWEDGERPQGTIGWTDDLERAKRMADSSVLHTEATEAWVMDRQEAKEVYQTRKATRWGL